MPNDDASRDLVQAGLQALDARFSDGQVSVDVGNYNAARIWKLYGTVAVKGDCTAARPHRLSKLWHVPGDIGVVTVEQLQSLAEQAPKPKAQPGSSNHRAYSGSGRLDVGAWLKEHNVDVLYDDTWKDGQKYILDRCLWNPEHNDKSAFIIQFANGAISAGCKHNSCSGKGWHDLRDAVEPSWRERRAATRPPRHSGDGEAANKTIIVSTDETKVIDEAIDVLAGCDNIYQRGGYLVQIVEGLDPPRGIARPKEAPRIGLTKFPRIRELLADAAVWLRPAGKGDLEQCHPPEWVVKAVDARAQWQGIRRLEAVVESPVLRADGSVLQAPGYDPDTGIVFRPECDFPEIPARPGRADAVRARDDLLEIVQDFPFADGTHRAAWLASVLTPAARYAFSGPAPLFLNDANVRGCGKSLLTDVVSVLSANRDMARMSLPRDDDELRKRITALAIAGEPLVLIDNVTGSFGSQSLDAALTSTSWSDRILGQTAMASAIPLYAVWYGTGNNVVLVGDTARRVVHIRLESPLERPEERRDFHHDDLLGWVRQERPRLAAAAVTLLAAYCAAGRPDMELIPWGSFEGWSALVRQCIVWAGLPDPGETRTQLISQADREATTLRQVIAGWEEVDGAGIGMTVATALRKLTDYPNYYETLRSALFELAPPRDGKALNPRSIGMRFHHLRRRVIGGKYLDRRESEGGAAIWVVVEAADSQGTKGAEGTKASYLAGAPVRARVNPEAANSSPLSAPSPSDAQSHDGDCQHPEVDETATHDGYVNRQCRVCGEWLQCRRVEA